MRAFHQKLRGRYAPSPTGLLHLGNARTALVAYLASHSQQGTFVMRIEDIDTQRCKPGVARQNLAELRWLGLKWEEGPDIGGPYGPYNQSERTAWYEQALSTLQAQGHTFECFLSRKDLSGLASAPHGGFQVYGEVQRDLNERLKADKRAQGKTPSIRLTLPDQHLIVNDLLAGEQHVALAHDIGDIVLRRADGMWAYQLAVVADDIAMDITHIVRGDDLLQSSAAQHYLYTCLGASPPEFAHVPLLLGPDGTRLAKRKGDLTLSALQQADVLPERVVGLLAYTLGLLPVPEPIPIEHLLPNFSLQNLSSEAFQLLPKHLSWLKA